MKPWAERTREEAHLLNPSFCCVTIASACSGYTESCGQTLSFALAFMVLPIILHKHTRESLPRTSRTSVPAWLQEHAEARIGFHERLMALQPFTREAMLYGLTFNCDWRRLRRHSVHCSEFANQPIHPLTGRRCTGLRVSRAFLG
jgi:hypothetical protein